MKIIQYKKLYYGIAFFCFTLVTQLSQYSMTLATSDYTTHTSSNQKIGSNEENIESQLYNLQEQLSSLQKSITALNDKVDIGLEKTDIRINLIEKNQNHLLNTAQDIGEPMIDMKLERIGESLESKWQNDKYGDTQSKISSTITDDKSIKEYAAIYSEMKSLYKKGENLKQIRDKFILFTKQYKNSSLISNAHYWIAEMYALDKLYDKAAIFYLNSYQTTSGERGLDSLYGLAQMLAKLHRYKEVCSTIAQINKEGYNLDPTIKLKLEKLQKECSCS